MTDMHLSYLPAAVTAVCGARSKDITTTASAVKCLKCRATWLFAIAMREQQAAAHRKWQR